jgi:Co/Zn/Cd efflux system component
LDAVTSVRAIRALLTPGPLIGFGWIDPVVGLIGAVVIASWAIGLMRDAARVLLDVTPDTRMLQAIRERLECQGGRIADLDVWQVGPGHRAATVSIIADESQAPSFYFGFPGLSVITVEVERCPNHELKSAS